MLGMVGRKLGMTRVFTEEGSSLPVTVLEMSPNRITQVRTMARDGYHALQVTAGSRRASRLTRPEAGQFSKANVEPGGRPREFRLNQPAGEEYSVGSELRLEIFSDGQKVDVTGRSKGKGFQGGVRRWNFRTQDATHGNSLSHRTGGSIGQCQTPGRVWKGKRMPGHMGDRRVTVQSLEVVRVDSERGLLLIKGAVPGPKGAEVLVRPAVKSAGS